ncbi:MAG: FAD-dependent monooxygenase [Beijerinckiaceae bacterium]
MSEPLHVVIAGAGIGGLTAALTLARTGARVTILERAPVLEEVGAGLQLSPNATNILEDLGVLDRLAPWSMSPEALRIRRGRDGSDLVRMPLGPLADARWGAPHLVVHRADLQRILIEACAGARLVTLRTDVEVLGFASVADGEHAAVQVGVLDAGRHARVDGDALIAADGLRSTIRERLGLGLSDAPVYSGRTAWRALVPAAQAPASALRVETNLWLGARAHLVHYPLRAGDLVNIVAVIEDPWRGEDSTDIWRDPRDADPKYLKRSFGGWAREARDLLDAAPQWRRWPLFERRFAPRWSVDNVVMMGDAAHPILPFFAQGAGLAIEDAEAIGRAFRTHGRDVRAAIRMYENERIPRASDIALASRRQGAIYHMSGPMAFARDAVMRRLTPDGMLRRVDWIYGYRQGVGQRRRLLP